VRVEAGLSARLAASQPVPAESSKQNPSSSLSSVFTPEVQRWAEHIQVWSDQYALSPALIATVMQIESCGDAQARSGAGAQGLFQVMPFHFAPGEAALEPETNARRGLAYLARSLELAEGRVDLALAGYNGGHSRISQASEVWPDETRRYVAWGSAIYADAASGRSASPALEAWLQAGGARLCRAASARRM
jgi:soluble lytic murein transglycosylase-like protein